MTNFALSNNAGNYSQQNSRAARARLVDEAQRRNRERTDRDQRALFAAARRTNGN